MRMFLVRDWDTTNLNDWGMNISTFKGFKPSEQKSLSGYNKVHVLLSFDPDNFHLIHEFLDQIKQTGVVEYEQAAN